MLFVSRDKRKFLKEVLSSYQTEENANAKEFFAFLKENINNLTNYLQPDIYCYSQEENRCVIIDFLPFACHEDNDEANECFLRLQSSLQHKEKSYCRYFSRIKQKLRTEPQFIVALFIENFSTNLGKCCNFSQQIYATAKMYSNADYIIYRDYARELHIFNLKKCHVSNY